jgi:hypothetical protein
MAGRPFFVANAASNIGGTVIPNAISEQSIDPALCSWIFV